MSFPERIKVAYRDYRVEEWHPHEAAGHGRLGECRPLPAVIAVDMSVDDKQQAETMMHEVLHAAFSSFSLPEKFESEEDCVSSVAAAYTTIFRDNPHLLEWLAEKLK